MTLRDTIYFEYEQEDDATNKRKANNVLEITFSSWLAACSYCVKDILITLTEEHIAEFHGYVSKDSIFDKEVA